MTSKKSFQIPMASVDHAWLRMDSPTNPMVINSVLTFKSKVDVERWRTVVRERFISIDHFQCKPSTIIYSDCWQSCEIDEDYHLQVDESGIDSDEELQLRATQFINIPLDHDRPLWRMKLVNFKNASAIFIRIHHSYADGMALVKVLMQLMDEAAIFNAAMKTNKNQHEEKKKVSLRKKILPFFKDQGRWFETLGVLDELTTELLQISLGTVEHNVFKTPGLCGKKQLSWTQPLNFSETRVIAKTHQAKLNDILLSSVAGAFRRYLMNLDKLSSWSELKTVIPVDLRGKINSQELGNYFGMVFLSLPIGISDPIERALLLNQRMQALKNSKQSWLVFQLLQLSGYLPDIAEKEMIRLFSSKASAVMTNVPGPQIPLHFQGSELDQILFWVPQSGSIGLGVSILTYNNKVQYGLMTDQQLVEKPSDIIDCFNDEFEQLLLETLMTAEWPS
jgi:WS/DGAT/MGAT family acyltransferase